jgi:hypothetical protein
VIQKTTIDEFTQARIARAAKALKPPWEQKLIDEDTERDGAVYIASVGALDVLVCYEAMAFDGLRIAVPLGIACIVSLVWFGRWLTQEARK